MSKLNKVLSYIKEQADPEGSTGILRGAGFSVLSRPAKISMKKKEDLLGLGLQLNKYLQGKINQIYCLGFASKKETRFIIYELDIKGNVSKTLVSDFLDFSYRNHRWTLLVIEGNYYIKTRDRIGRGKFEDKYLTGRLSDFRRFDMPENTDSIMHEIVIQLDPVEF